MTIYQLGDRVPQIDPSAYVFDTATLIGTVILGARVSIWPYATLRGDNEPIKIGDESNVQECSVLHADPGFPLTIGRRVTVGHQVMLHGCTIGDGSLIGIQAIVLNSAVIGRNCLIGAGALVTEGKQIPDGSLVIGSPAKVIRQLEPDHIERIRRDAESYVQRAVAYRRDLKRIS
ncbi:MAG TPA: gamma carbonic anhydrase family protein [Burkholderiaceae bacterium]|jgi:carbonic anhydrase/acetyltransferase-like protein (isoleucine patch superfamily)|nr:gamma carbonic anhydrase family protein [Burkholderiaceae bacterium]